MAAFSHTERCNTDYIYNDTSIAIQQVREMLSHPYTAQMLLLLDPLNNSVTDPLVNSFFVLFTFIPDFFSSDLLKIMSEVKTAPKKRGRPKKVSGLAALDAAAAPPKTTKVVKVKAPVKKAKSPEPKPEPVQQPEPEPEPEPVAPVVEEPEPVVAAPPTGGKKGKSRKKPAKVDAVAEPAVAVVKPSFKMTPESKDALSKHMKGVFDGGLDIKEGKSVRMKLMNRMSRKGMTLEEAIADIA